MHFVSVNPKERFIYSPLILGKRLRCQKQAFKASEDTGIYQRSAESL